MMNKRVVSSAAASVLPLMQASSNSSSSRASPLALTYTQNPGPAKRAKTDVAPHKGRGKGKMSKAENNLDEKYQNNMNYKRVPEHLRQFLKPGLNLVQANAALRDAINKDKLETYAIFKWHCRNCWAAGKGWVAHTLSACRQAGTTCALECPICRTGQCHWAEQCPKKSCVLSRQYSGCDGLVHVSCVSWQSSVRESERLAPRVFQFKLSELIVTFVQLIPTFLTSSFWLVGSSDSGAAICQTPLCFACKSGNIKNVMCLFSNDVVGVTCVSASGHGNQIVTRVVLASTYGCFGSCYVSLRSPVRHTSDHLRQI